MNIKLFDTVVLETDIPSEELRAGDLGAVVELYEPDGLEVEFITASGKTQALVTLNVADVRPVTHADILAVRSMNVA
jgi:hypothetical protein